MLSTEDQKALLIPIMPYHKLKIGQYIYRGKKRKLFKGEYITSVSHEVDDLYYFYVEKGQLGVTFPKINGEGITLCYRNAGNAFPIEYGGIASIGDYKMHWMATTDTIVYGFTQRQLFEIAQEDPEIFYEFIFVCHMIFGQISHRITCTSAPSSMDRIAFWIIKLCAVTTPDENGFYTIATTITNQQLADFLFMHVTTCSRLFNTLQKDGILKRTRKQIIVYHLDKLLDHISKD